MYEYDGGVLVMIGVMYVVCFDINEFVFRWKFFCDVVCDKECECNRC